MPNLAPAANFPCLRQLGLLLINPTRLLLLEIGQMSDDLDACRSEELDVFQTAD